MRDLSILIPSRNEMWLAKTIENILENIEADTEIIAVLDGAWADPAIAQHERVNIVYLPDAIGQRAGTNLAARLAQGKYVAKVDAHCAFDKGFDRKMIEMFKDEGDDIVAVPIMKNLHAFDWKCFKCGSRWYQGPTPKRCMRNVKHGTEVNVACDETKNFQRRIVWKPRKGTHAASYCFDAEPHFQYFGEYCETNEYKTDLLEKGYTKTMSLQGSFFMSSLENFWKWELSDEKLGNWGNQGIELACAAWLSGGRVLVNHKTWYAHMFRTQGGDFGFPWDNKGSDTKRTKDGVKDKFWNKKHPTQKLPVSWLIERFWPVKGWTEEDLKKIK